MVVAGAGDCAADRMNILIDTNLSPRWKSTLKTVDIEAVHWFRGGDTGAADSVFASHALSSGLIVLTQDLDFGAFVATSGDSGPSVIQIRTDDTSHETIGEKIISADAKRLAAATETCSLHKQQSRFRIVSITPVSTKTGELKRMN